MKKQSSSALILFCSISLIGCGELVAPQSDEPDFAWAEATEIPQTQSVSGAIEDDGSSEGNRGSNRNPSNLEISKFEDEVIAWVNDVRATGADCGEHGSFAPARPMRGNGRLAAAARKHSKDMARHDKMSHEGSDGTRFWDRVDSEGYDGTARGENVAVGYPSAQEVVQAWLESDGHCLILMLPETNEIGVGYSFRDQTRYGHFWTMVTGID